MRKDNEMVVGKLNKTEGAGEMQMQNENMEINEYLTNCSMCRESATCRPLDAI